MTLHVDQTILSAVQQGTCAEFGKTNPYKPENKKRFLGWEQGYENVIKGHEHQQKIQICSFYRRFLCCIGIHKYHLKLIPGRPHINPQTRDIDSRDPIIKKYVCIYCDETYFIGLDEMGFKKEKKK